MKEYKKLNKFEEYDREAAEELAEALTEISTLGKRIAQLSELVQENPELRTFVWTTAEGKSYAIHKLEDDHFKNILQYLVNNNNRFISKSLKAEARRRGFEIPTAYMTISRSGRELTEGEIVDQDEELDDDRFESVGPPYDRRQVKP